MKAVRGIILPEISSNTGNHFKTVPNFTNNCIFSYSIIEVRP